MKPKHYILLVFLALFLFFAGSSVFFFWMWKKSEETSDQRFENLYQVMNESDAQIVLQTQEELAKIRPDLKALIDSLEIKHVTQIHQTDYHYSTDSIITILIPLDTLPHDSITKFSFSLDTACLSFSGIVSLPRVSERVVPSGKILFTNISFNDQITTLYFWQRQRLFNWSWTPRWGKKQFRAKTHSNCTDSIKTIDIKINKQ